MDKDLKAVLDGILDELKKLNVNLASESKAMNLHLFEIVKASKAILEEEEEERAYEHGDSAD